VKHPTFVNDVGGVGWGGVMLIPTLPRGGQRLRRSRLCQPRRTSAHPSAPCWRNVHSSIARIRWRPLPDRRRRGSTLRSGNSPVTKSSPSSRLPPMKVHGVRLPVDTILFHMSAILEPSRAHDKPGRFRSHRRGTTSWREAQRGSLAPKNDPGVRGRMEAGAPNPLRALGLFRSHNADKCPWGAGAPGSGRLGTGTLR
jgi:hypothetical protein